MTDTPSFDEIPVLTEVVAEPVPLPVPAPDAAAGTPPAAALAAAAAEPAVAPLEDAARPEPASAASGPAASDAPGDDAWRALEERLVARVLDRLQPRIDVVLEDQVRGQMAIVLDHVAERLALELRAALQQSIEHVVARAVQQELAHLTTRQS
jgi:hypothetical protein